MNLEKTKEILDTISFILVTPEFLGEQRLKYVRGELRKIRNRISQFYDNEVAMNIIGSLLLAIVVFVFIVVMFIIPRDQTWGPVTRTWFYLTLTVIFLLFFAASILAAEMLAVRGRLFIVGSCLFFLTRALAVLHAGVPS